MSFNGQKSGNATERLVDSMDQMVRWPFQMTGATWDLMMEGMQAVTGRPTSRTRTAEAPASKATSTERAAGPNWTSIFSGQGDQDLSGDDLKYVIWSIVFTKPTLECVLEPQHEEIVNYAADGASFAAVKIAKFLDKARHGRVDKPESWRESGYPAEAAHRAESAAEAGASSSGGTKREHGWRVPAEDQKYIKFLYRVDRRLPRQEAEVVERVTIERNTTKIV